LGIWLDCTANWDYEHRPPTSGLDKEGVKFLRGIHQKKMESINHLNNFNKTYKEIMDAVGVDQTDPNLWTDEEDKRVEAVGSVFKG
jgi:hypothetical protein